MKYLIVFDFDGTLCDTVEFNYMCLNKALELMQYKESISLEVIKAHLGESSQEFYPNVLPESAKSNWFEVRKLSREIQPEYMKKYGKTFPEVKETLKKLKEKGLNLALYSNSSREYLNNAVKTFEIEECFDYIESVAENNLSKKDLVKKIGNKFGNPETFIVGDKFHDIEAAKKNSYKSIGCLYGYGKGELTGADYTINEFSDLLNIFSEKKEIFEKIESDIITKIKNKAFIIGINGVDTSGKTTFAKELEKYLKIKNYKIQTINIDDFHNPQAIRNSGNDPVDNFLNKTFNYSELKTELLEPLKTIGKIEKEMIVYNLHTDKYETKRIFNIDNETIVLLEGIFLFREELVNFFDYKIYIDISFDEVKKRAEIRDVPIFGIEFLKKYDTKYIPAQKIYINNSLPHKQSDLVIDNNNYKFPKIIKF